MCFAIDLFQALDTNKKCIVVLFIIEGVFSLVYFTVVALIFVLLEQSPENRVEHWEWIFFGLAFLIWAVGMLTITMIWCLCRHYALGEDHDDQSELGEVNEKAKKTLGISKNERSSLIIKPPVEDVRVDVEQITPLPEYSPEARSSIFDFSEEGVEKLENERSHSPFQEFLHLVQVESPGSPAKTLRPTRLNRISEEPMYDIPLRIETPKSVEEPAEFEWNDKKPLIEERAEKTAVVEEKAAKKPVVEEKAAKKPLVEEKAGKKLTKKKSQMFLGNIGKSSSVVSELFVELDKGGVVPESAVIMGRYQVLTDCSTD